MPFSKNLLFPSTKEIEACSGAYLRVVYDLLSGKVLSFEKNSSLVKDADLASLVQSGMSAFNTQLHALLQ